MNKETQNNQINWDESASLVQIYLFSPNGEFYWCNDIDNVGVENQAVLHSGLFATLYKLAIESFGEQLKDLMINELRINIFSISKEFLVAIVTPKYLKIDPRKIQKIEQDIYQAFAEIEGQSKKAMIDTVVTHLEELLYQLMDWLNTYAYQSEIAVSILTEQIGQIEDLEVAAFLYTWDWNRVFKYIPSSIELDYQIETIVDTIVKNIEGLPSLHQAEIIVNNTIISFIVKEMILVLAKSISEQDESHEVITATYQNIKYSAKTLGTVVDDIIVQTKIQKEDMEE